MDPSEPPGRSGTQMLKLLYKTVERYMQSVLATLLCCDETPRPRQLTEERFYLVLRFYKVRVHYNRVESAGDRHVSCRS